MFAILFRRCWCGLAVAAMVAVGSGCGGESDAGPGSETITTVAPATEGPASDPLASLRLDQFWVLPNRGCTASELEVRQSEVVATLVTVCQRGRGVLRLINQTLTSVRVRYPLGSVQVRYEGSHLPDGRVTVEVLRLLDAGYVQGAGYFVLPAGDSAVMTISGQLPTVAADPTHGSTAFYARTIGKLVEQLPWDKIGELDSIAAKSLACVGGALSLAEARDLAIDEAIDTSKDCLELAKELSLKWERQASTPAPAADVLRTRLSTAAQVGAPPASTVRRLVTGLAQLLR